jgi:hypothetical protein
MAILKACLTAIGLAMVFRGVFGRCRGSDFLARSARENQPGCRIGIPGLAMAIYTVVYTLLGPVAYGPSPPV